MDDNKLKPRIYVVKSTLGHELLVAERIYSMGKKIRNIKSRTDDNTPVEDVDDLRGMEPINSVVYTPDLRGYVLVEAYNPGAVWDIIRDVPKVKGMILYKKGDINSAGTISYEELEKALKPEPMVSKLHKSDLVEIITGSFKGEKARVVKIDSDHDKVTIELIEAAVPIPVTVRGDDLKILRSEYDELDSDS